MKEVSLKGGSKVEITSYTFLLPETYLTGGVERRHHALSALTPIYIKRHSGSIYFSDCEFTDNHGIYGGAVSIKNFIQNTVNSIAFVRCKFLRNFSFMSGGAIFIHQSKKHSPPFFNDELTKCSAIIIYESMFEHNFANKFGNGGAISYECDAILD
jgi:hypothetical protein